MGRRGSPLLLWPRPRSLLELVSELDRVEADERRHVPRSELLLDELVREYAGLRVRMRWKPRQFSRGATEVVVVAVVVVVEPFLIRSITSRQWRRSVSVHTRR